MPWLARGHACSAPGFRTILCPLAQFCVVPACSRFIFVSNHLPVRCARGETGWEFEWDEDALIARPRCGCCHWLLRLSSAAPAHQGWGTVCTQPWAASVHTTYHSGLGGSQWLATSAMHEPSRSSELRPAVGWPEAGTGEDCMLQKCQG